MFYIGVLNAFFALHYYIWTLSLMIWIYLMNLFSSNNARGSYFKINLEKGALIPK